MTNRAFVYLILFLLVVYGFVFLAAFEPPLEDAFISFRCAQNLIEGRGLVYNPGERVEAYSNLLWVLLLAPLGGLLGDFVLASKLLGLLFGGITLVLVMILARRFAGNPWAVAFPAVLLLGSPYFLTFTVYGLETPLQWTLLLSLLWALVNERWTAAGVALGLVPWCRPEGYFYLLPILLLVAWWERGRVRWLRFLLPSLGLTALLLMFRLLYYHDWLPNTVYSKSIPLVPGASVYLGKLARGFTQAFHFFLDGRFAMWLPLWVLGLLLIRKSWRQERIYRWALALGVVQFTFVVVSGGNLFHRYRFLAVIYPLLALGAARGLAAVEALERRRIHSVVLAVLALLGTVTQVEYERSGGFYWQGRYETLKPYRNLPQFLGDRLGRLGDVPPTLNARLGFLLRDSFPPGTLLATGQIGQIGFYSGRPILDMVGLADWTIAHQGGTLEYFLERRPQVFLLLGSQWILDSPSVGVFPGLWGTDEFRRLYAWKRVYKSEPPTETFYWIERRKTPLQQPPREPDRPEVFTLPLDGERRE